MTKTIVITGGSSGIGKAIISILKSHNIISLSRKTGTDITSISSVKKAFNPIKSIDVLINNAGVFKSTPFKDCNPTDIDNIIDTNLKGTLYCTHEALKKMTSGNIINICSVAGKHGIKNQSIYCASKYGMRGFAEALSQELKNIQITTIYLGGTNTPLRSNITENKESLLLPSQVANIVLQIINKEQNIYMKEITVFPSNEWH